MSRFSNLLCAFVSLAMVIGLTTPVLAGPLPTPATPTPATPTPATANPGCETDWPVTTIFTIGKSDGRFFNPLVFHEITGNIIDPTKHRQDTHRIIVCKGTFVKAVIRTPGGFCANNTALGTLDCDRDCHVCEGVVNSRERYTSVNNPGSDTDKIQIIPQ